MVYVFRRSYCKISFFFQKFTKHSTFNSKDGYVLVFVQILYYHKNIPYTLNEVISSHHTIFAPVQKVKIALTKFKLYQKAQGFVETLQIMSFQNDWWTLHRRGPSKGTIISKSHTFWCDINYSSDTLSIYILISMKMFIIAVI